MPELPLSERAKGLIDIVLDEAESVIRYGGGTRPVPGPRDGTFSNRLKVARAALEDYVAQLERCAGGVKP